MQPILYENHCHTPLCGHSVGEPPEYAAHALKRNLQGINITCHGPTPFEWGHCMRQREWPEYLELIEAAREEFAGEVDVKTGVECDFMPGMEAYWREFLGQNELSHVLGSIHPQVGAYRERFWNGNAFDYARKYFQNLALAAETGLFDTLSHPDLVKNTIPRDWDLEFLRPDIENALDRIAATGTAMELNTSGLQKTIREMNPGPQILEMMAARQIPVVLGADAHVPERVAANFEDALDLCEAAGFEKVSFFVDRERQDVEIGEVRASLRRLG